MMQLNCVLIGLPMPSALIRQKPRSKVQEIATHHSIVHVAIGRIKHWLLCNTQSKQITVEHSEKLMIAESYVRHAQKV
jgi:hypothetical protein